MRCPDCYEEVIVGDLNCPYCGADIEEIIDLDPGETRGLMSLVTVSDETEAYAIKDLLENHGIPAAIESYKGSGSIYTSDDDVWGEILVPQGSLDLAFNVVNTYTESAGKPIYMEEVTSDEYEDEEAAEETDSYCEDEIQDNEIVSD